MTVTVEKRKEAVLMCPDFIKPFKQNSPDTICIDIEIADVIQKLWDNKIITLGCCSGHGEKNPSIVLSKDYDNKKILDIKFIIANADVQHRDWDLFQWKLCKV